MTTSLEGKSAFPEDHPLSLGSGGVAMPASVLRHVQDADVVFGVGASFTATGFGIRFPTDEQDVHPQHDRPDGHQQEHPGRARAGRRRQADALAGSDEAASERLGGKPRGRREEVVSKIKTQKDEWLQQWMPQAHRRRRRR